MPASLPRYRTLATLLGIAAMPVLLYISLRVHAAEPPFRQMWALTSRTVVIGDRYVSVPWSMPPSSVAGIAKACADQAVLLIEEGHFGVRVLVAADPSPPAHGPIPALRLAAVRDGRRWRLSDPPGDPVKYDARDRVAGDMDIWQSFAEFALRSAKLEGFRLTRSDRVVFVPGESFGLRQGRVTLRYHVVHWQARPGDFTTAHQFAVIAIDGIQAWARSRRSCIPRETDVTGP